MQLALPFRAQGIAVNGDVLRGQRKPVVATLFNHDPLEPVFIVDFRIVQAQMGAAALLAEKCCSKHGFRTKHHVPGLKRKAQPMGIRSLEARNVVLLDLLYAAKRPLHLLLCTQNVDVVGEEGFLNGYDHMGGIAASRMAHGFCHGPGSRVYLLLIQLHSIHACGIGSCGLTGNGSRGGGSRHGVGAKALHARGRTVGRIACCVEALQSGATVDVDPQSSAKAHVANEGRDPFELALATDALVGHVACLHIGSVHEGQCAREKLPILRSVGGVVKIKGATPEMHFHGHGGGNTPQVAVGGVLWIVLGCEILAKGVHKLGAQALGNVHAVGGKASVCQLVAVELVIAKGSACIEAHDVGIASHHMQICIVGLVGLGASGEHNGLGPEKIELASDTVETHNAAYGIGFLFVVHKAHAHDAIHNLYARLFTGLAHDFHELGAVEHERLDGTLVRGALTFDTAIGTVLVLLEDHAPGLQFLHSVADGVEMLLQPVLIIDVKAFFHGLSVPQIKGIFFLEIRLERSGSEGTTAALTDIGLIDQGAANVPTVVTVTGDVADCAVKSSVGRAGLLFAIMNHVASGSYQPKATFTDCKIGGSVEDKVKDGSETSGPVDISEANMDSYSYSYKGANADLTVTGLSFAD